MKVSEIFERLVDCDALVGFRAFDGSQAGSPDAETIVEVLVAHQPAVTLLLRVRGNSEVEVRALSRRRHIDARLAALKARGVRLIDETPRPGAHGSRIAFIHPASTNGLLIELNSLLATGRASMETMHKALFAGPVPAARMWSRTNRG